MPRSADTQKSSLPLKHCFYLYIKLLAFPGGSSDKEPACHRRRHKEIWAWSWVEKFPWRRNYNHWCSLGLRLRDLCSKWSPVNQSSLCQFSFVIWLCLESKIQGVGTLIPPHKFGRPCDLFGQQNDTRLMLWEFMRALKAFILLR